jgi:hypothetical protein
MSHLDDFILGTDGQTPFPRRYDAEHYQWALDYGRHSARRTSPNPRSGDGGRHSAPEGLPLGLRLCRPHAPDGWDGSR